ncbi:acetylornithine deacetylase [Halovulum dunhuangense]|uniref:Acetylornithine deacetylase n=1 Tax=Halovulum dunhuangense TaxID=1505036 RepID=A0A849L3S5_9RHOB|nr:acetylornithine deacetylase [Halovulum dunhuangense]NNU80903.1 acetylornithine deacetylase [Halovulum dunhuangense]
MSLLADSIAELDRLVAFPTVSARPNIDMARHLARRLADLGARVELIATPDGTKANVLASLGPEGDGGIVLSGHTDVVPVEDQEWSTDPFALHQADGRLYGRGTCDMKGFIAACMAVAPRLAARELRRPLHFAFTYDEETGCLGAQHLVETLRARRLRPALAIIGEPTSMRMVEGHKGCCEYTTIFTGREGHGSDPGRGVNAVEYAVRYAARLLELRADLTARAPDPSRFDPPWTTINLGRLSGGQVHNVIPPRAEIDWEMRPVTQADADHVRASLARLVEEELLPEMRRTAPESAIETRVIGEVAGLVPMEENAARDLVAALTGANAADCVPFGTEAGLFQSLGMSVVVCGPGAIAQAHKADEYLETAQLEACLDMLTALEADLVRDR